MGLFSDFGSHGKPHKGKVTGGISYTPISSLSKPSKPKQDKQKQKARKVSAQKNKKIMRRIWRKLI
jgi:hypothetical protein